MRVSAARPGEREVYGNAVFCRQLPFRAAGAVSEWRVTRPERHFDDMATLRQSGFVNATATRGQSGPVKTLPTGWTQPFGSSI